VVRRDVDSLDRSGQVPDPANRQMQMIEELKLMNGKMDELMQVLRSGDLQVKVAKTEEDKGKTPAPPTARGSNSRPRGYTRLVKQ
jgi:hypothetical protein